MAADLCDMILSEYPSDKVLELIENADEDNRTQEEIYEEFKDKNKARVVFNFEIIPLHLKYKSKIIRLKKSITNIDKLSMNRTYLRKDDYKALHNRVILKQLDTAGAIAIKTANITESLDNDIYVHDVMHGLDKFRSIYILTVEISGSNLHRLDNDDMHHHIGDVIQQTVFSTLVINETALLVRPVTIEK